MKSNRLQSQNRALQIATVIALVFGAYFLWRFFTLIIFAFIAAYLFNPIYKRFCRRFKRKSTAASFTLLTSFLALIIPLTLIVVVAIYQIKLGINTLSSKDPVEFGNLVQQFVDWLNHIIIRIPGIKPVSIEQLQNAVGGIATTLSKGLLDALSGSVSSITGFITNSIIYIYVFINILIFQDSLVELVKRLNPLGRERSEIYLSKMASMTKAMAKGQFIIAIVQGLTDALLLYIAGLRSVFILMSLILTVLSIIPLGGGIIVLPIGIVMLLTGHIWQGLLVLLGHILIVGNEDNILRPKLVPKETYLNPALTLLSVFAGVGMFGFLGIIIGPVLMILIVSTIQMYLEAYPEKSN